MRRDLRNVTIGLLVGFCLALALGAAGDGELYRLHVWSVRSPAAGINADHGAYRVNTTTGEVFEIKGNNNTATQISFPNR
jgi:hypothetical protein